MMDLYQVNPTKFNTRQTVGVKRTPKQEFRDLTQIYKSTERQMHTSVIA